MKHKIFILGLMMTCLLGLTACGSETQYNTVEGSRYHPQLFTNENISNTLNAFEDYFEMWYLEGITPDNFEEKLYFDLAMTQTGDFNDEMFNSLASGYDSWYKAVDDIGYGSLETLQNDISVGEVTYYINKDGELVADATIVGNKHSALMEVYLDQTGIPTDMGVTINKTIGEKLENAGLNTLLGMGMAFAILILISLIISLFPILFGGKKKKKESDVEIAQKAIENTVTQIADKEDLSSDAELVAVIAAAIAAYEGSASTDGFRVRSIRKVNRNWKNNK